MENKELLQKLNFLVKEINDTHARLQRANDNFQEIECALLTRQVVNLYQHLQRLQDSYRRARLQSSAITQKPGESKEARLRRPQAETQPEPVSPEPTPIPTPRQEEVKAEQQQTPAEPIKETPVSEIKPEPATQPKPTPAPSKPAFNFSTSSSRAEQTPEPQPKPETFTTPVENKEEIKQTAQETIVPPQPMEAPAAESAPQTQQPIAETEKHDQSLNEKHTQATEGRSINERFAQMQVKKNLADKLKLSPIKDIKAAMSLNQRISFIKNLFKGNDEEFLQTVTFINNLKSFNEAKFYIQSEVNSRYKWEEENPLVQEFMELVYRKFL
jgi:hypothetical protein